MTRYVGILGMGANATSWYHQKIQSVYREKFGNDEVCPVKILQIPFKTINDLLPDNMEEASKQLSPFLSEIDEMGVENFVLGNITLHQAIDLIPTGSKKFIHIADILQRKLPTQKSKVMVIGSSYTMQSSYLSGMIEKLGHEIIRLNSTLMQKIDDLRKVYYVQPDADWSRLVFSDLESSHPEVDRFVIACTEHAMALDDYGQSDRFLSLPEEQCRFITTSIFTA